MVENKKSCGTVEVIRMHEISRPRPKVRIFNIEKYRKFQGDPMPPVAENDNNTDTHTHAHPTHAFGKGWTWNVGVHMITVQGKKYSRNQIHKGTGMDRALVTRIFTGERKPTLATALKLAAFFKCSVEHLLGVVIPANVRRANKSGPRPVESVTDVTMRNVTEEYKRTERMSERSRMDDDSSVA